MSLSGWLRRSLSIPLGGNRHGRLRTHFNLFTTMVLGGLWHGASWTFVLWGALHGGALVFVSIWRRYGAPLPSLLGWALTLAFVLLTGVIFRTASLEAAARIYEGLAIMPDIKTLTRALPIL